MDFSNYFKKTTLYTACVSAVATLATGFVFAAQNQAYTIGESGTLIANSDAQVSVNETDGGYNIDLAKGGLCFSVDQSTPLTITADGAPVNLNGFGTSVDGSIHGMVSVDDNGVYAGSTTSCEGINSVTTTGDGLFGLDAQGIVIIIAGIVGGFAAFDAVSDNDNDNGSTTTPPANPPQVTPAPVPGTGGGGGGGAGGGGGGGGMPVASPN